MEIFICLIYNKLIVQAKPFASCVITSKSVMHNQVRYLRTEKDLNKIELYIILKSFFVASAH